MNDVLKAIKVAEQALSSARSALGDHPSLAAEAARVKEAHGELSQIRLVYLTELLAIAKALGVGRERLRGGSASVDPQRDMPFHAAYQGLKEEWVDVERLASNAYGACLYICEHLADRISGELARITRDSNEVARAGNHLKEVRALVLRSTRK